MLEVLREDDGGGDVIKVKCKWSYFLLYYSIRCHEEAILVRQKVTILKIT